MKGFINGFDWVNAEAMKYWQPPASYSLEKKKEEAHNAIFSGQYWGARKVDGYYQRLIKDDEGNCFMIARNKNVNGEAVNKYEWVPQLSNFMEKLPNGTVLLSECYIPGEEGSKNITSLLGCLKEKCIMRQNNGKMLHFYIFDICAYGGKDLIKEKAINRFKLLEEISTLYNTEYIEWAKYYCGKELWDNLQTYLSEGLEGVVITRFDCPIYFKRTPAHMTIKVKKELEQTIDVIIIGANQPTREYNGKEIESWKYWENIRTNEKLEGEYYKDYFNGGPIEPITKMYYLGAAGSLKIGLYNDSGKIVQIGSLSGLNEEVLLNWKDYCGKICEINGMQIFYDNNGNFSGIRHPKFVRLRDDKKENECTFNQLF